MGARFHSRPRIPRGQATKLELAFEGQLQFMQLAGEITRWMREPFKLRLAQNTTYTPDYGAFCAKTGELYLYEVKAFWEDDARAKFKIAAAQYPEFHLVAVMRTRGVWNHEEGPT